MNSKKEIIVTVAGSAGSGKSVFMTEILEMLESHGIECSVESLDYDRDRFVKDNIVERAIPFLRDNVKVKVVEQQLPRKFMGD